MVRLKRRDERGGKTRPGEKVRKKAKRKKNGRSKTSVSRKDPWEYARGWSEKKKQQT